VKNLREVLQRKKGFDVNLGEEFQRNLLQNFKVLNLYNESDVFPYEILKQIPSIEKLVVCDGSFKEIFYCQSPNNVDYSGVVSQLKVLHLKSLKDLISIVSDNSLAETFLRNLETLQVNSCSSLINLVKCRVPFFNLTYLKVENCGSLTYLFTSSTAKNLVQLKRMEIENCKSIEEIVSKEVVEESNDDEITFPHLSWMNLESLRNLRRFYKGSLSFSSLEKLSIITCPSMETLCLGTVKADNLSQVIVGMPVETIPLEINLNSTLRKTFLTKVCVLMYIVMILLLYLNVIKSFLFPSNNILF